MAHTQDDAFHEIQLNGKQLVFLFMFATIMSVGIFLCGVLVGRGVRAERGGAAADAAAAAPEPTPAPSQMAGAQTPTPAGSDPRAAAPPPAVDDLSYFNRLDKPNQPKEELKAVPDKAPRPSPEKAPPVEVDRHARASSPPPAPAPQEPAAKPAPTTGESAGDYAVQVAALNAREEADAIAKRLASKGYQAYVVPPGNGAVMFRVRVGHFKTRRDAEPVFAKLQKEEQFKPWITR